VVSPARTPALSGTPLTEATVLPEPVEVVIPVTPTRTPTPATPKPTPTPKSAPAPAPTTTVQPSAESARAQQQAAQIAGLITRAEQAIRSDQFDAAQAIYEEVLGLDPQNAQARSGRDEAAAAAFAWKRSFVPGRTTVSGGKGGRADLTGFESTDVKVAKAPDYSGIIDFQPSPTRVKPGDSYSIVVSLTNDGKRDYRVASASATLVVDNRGQELPVAPPAGEIASRKSVTLTRTGGTWPTGVQSWRLEVTIQTTHGETFTNRLTWR
jgi:hypothetical protein